MAKSAGFDVRLSVKDQEVVNRALAAMGADGEKALKKIEKATAASTASTRALTTTLQEGRSVLDGYAGSAGSLGSIMQSMGPWGAAAAAGVGAIALGVTALTNKAREAAQYFDQLGDAADRLGIGVEPLQALQFAAAQVGVSAEQLTTGIEKLGQGLSQLAGGEANDATAALKRLGIEARDAQAPAEQSLGKIADGLAKVQTQAERVDLVKAIFGKSGGGLIPMLADGAAKLNAMQQEARDLGAVIDADIVKRGADAADKIEALSLVFNNQLRSATIDILPHLIRLGQVLAEMAGWIARVADGFRELEDRASTSLKTRIGGINEELAKMNAEQQNPSWLKRNLPNLGAQDDADRRAMLEAERARLQEELRRREAAAPASGGQSSGSNVTPWRSTFNPGKDPKSKTKKPDNGTGFSFAPVGSFRAAQDLALSEGEDLSKDIQKTYDEIDAARKEDQARADEYTKHLKEGLKDVTDTTAVEFDIMGQVVGDVFAQMATGGEITAKSIIQSLTRVLLSQAFQQLMKFASQQYGGAGGLSGILGSLLGGGGSAGYGATGSGQVIVGPGGTLGGGVAHGAAWGDPGVRYLAAGGIINSPMLFSERGGMTVAGEAGPEAVMPLTRYGGKLGVTGSAAVVNVAVNNYGGADVRARDDGRGGAVIDIDKAVAGVLARPDSMSHRAVHRGPTVYRG
jgi:hypothetical protein